MGGRKAPVGMKPCSTGGGEQTGELAGWGTTAAPRHPTPGFRVAAGTQQAAVRRKEPGAQSHPGFRALGGGIEPQAWTLLRPLPLPRSCSLSLSLNRDTEINAIL